MKFSSTHFLKNTLSSMLLIYVLTGAIVLMNLSRSEIAVTRLNHLKDAGYYPINYLSGHMEFDKFQFRQSLKYYRTLLVIIPDYEEKGFVDGPTALSRTHSMIALCNYYLGKTHEAVSHFKKALKYESKHYWLNYDLGLIYFQNGNNTQALEYFKKCIMLTPGDLDKSLQLDYIHLWEAPIASQYQKTSELLFYQIIRNSYKISILANERMNQMKEARELSLTAIHSGIAPQDPFFTSHAGLSIGKDIPLPDNLNLVFSPSLLFAPIGQEKLYIKEQHDNKLKLRK